MSLRVLQTFLAWVNILFRPWLQWPENERTPWEHHNCRQALRTGKRNNPALLCDVQLTTCACVIYHYKNMKLWSVWMCRPADSCLFSGRVTDCAPTESIPCSFVCFYFICYQLAESKHLPFTSLSQLMREIIDKTFIFKSISLSVPGTPWAGRRGVRNEFALLCLTKHGCQAAYRTLPF